MSQETMFENTEQCLLELLADFLDSETVRIDEVLAGIKDPIGSGETDLHIRMAKAAMQVYRETVVPV